MPDEWFGYVIWKYNETSHQGGGGLNNDRDFGWPWFLHMKRNAHHWQYWVYADDNGEIYPLEIPEPYLTELVVDWCASGIVRFGTPGLEKYYSANKNKMHFHPTTKAWLEVSLKIAELAYANCQRS